ncbi:MAG: hypothetical protein HOP15_17560 [Planctomycetes bacterium]|nr:hypothetical protein [Planctomycetota bacterium]
MRAHAIAILASALLSAGCLAPPPPIVVETPYGAVRAHSAGKAGEVAELLQRLAPEVKALLPGAQDRPIDVWVQDQLAVFMFHERPESVRGFTLLDDEFRAKRIHLQEGGQSPWYLAHELVHALIGPSWSPLPGILEEGLGDVIAEALNPEYQEHIRSHRLLNASAFTGGLELEIIYREPGEGPWRARPIVSQSVRLQLGPPVAPGTLAALLGTPRSALHRRWADIPESFYGISWLIVSRAVERIGFEGLHELCLRATREGRELMPIEWLETAAELRLDELDARFLAGCFDRPAMQTALFLQPEAFAEVLLDSLLPLREKLSFSGVFERTKPSIRLADASEVPVRSYSGPVYRALRLGWNASPLAKGVTTAP